MGIFSPKKEVSVASSVYNLAGEEKNRPIFLKNLIVRNVLSGTKRSLGDTVTTGYLNGPGITYRSFYRWALEHYDAVDLPTGSMKGGDTLNTILVGDNIPLAPGQGVWVQEASFGESDYTVWAEQWMLANYPEEVSTEWETDFDDDTLTVHIKRTNNVEHSFVASDFVPGATYIFAYITRTLGSSNGPIVNGPLISLGLDPFPSVSGYTLLSTETIDETVTLYETTVVDRTYSDGRPDEHDTSTTSEDVEINSTIRKYMKKVSMGNDPISDAKLSRINYRTLYEDGAVSVEVTSNTVVDTVDGDVTRTTVTTVTTDTYTSGNSYQDGEQDVVEKEWLPLELWIYRLGSGIPALDILVDNVGDFGKFFPIIPIRINNAFLDEIPGMETVLEQSKKAFKKATRGTKYDKIRDQIAEHENLADMDYVYTIFGITLNTLDNSARRYLFEFFRILQGNQSGGASSGDDFLAGMAAFQAEYSAWVAWKNDNSIGAAITPEPPIPIKPALPTNFIKISTVNLNYDIRIQWNFILDNEGIGLGKPGAKKGDYWLEHRGYTMVTDFTYTGDGDVTPTTTIGYDTTRIYFQYEDNKYKYLDIMGLEHHNYIYPGKFVAIGALEALSDGEESAFIVPLHYNTFRASRLLDATQAGTVCVWLMINSYKVTKQKWWQNGFFQIIIVVVVAILSVVLTGGAGIGLLGAHLAVGTALGLTGMTAAIAGAIANAFAAMILTTLITKLTENWGVLGSIIATVLSFIVTGAMSSFTSGTGFAFNFTELMKAENLLKLVDATGRGYQSVMQASINDIQSDLTKLQDQANSELRRVREAFTSQFGYGGGQIDPMMFIGSNNPVLAESRDTFLTRTLMTGSDVANMSFDMLNNYVELTQTLPNAFT